jgi:conjugative relaxase-like TrwC/TraI family protein
MLTGKTVSPKQAAAYYYAEDNSPGGSRWFGKLAKQIGLEGEIGISEFKHALYGRAPNGIRVRAHGNQDDKTRAASDMVFSAPKSVSIQALVQGDTRIIEAHQKAVEKVLTEIEQKYSICTLRTGGWRRDEVTGKLVVAMFLHATSRELDPQLHTHCLIMNFGSCSDGKWRSFKNDYFFDHYRRQLGVHYQEALAENIQALGYEVQWQVNDTFEIQGYTRAQILEFSQRRQQILLAATGTGGWSSWQEATLKTRRAKQHMETDALQQDWQRRADQMLIPFPMRDSQPVFEMAALEPVSTDKPNTFEELIHGRTSTIGDRDQEAERSAARTFDRSGATEPDVEQGVGHGQRAADVCRAAEQALDGAQSSTQPEQRGPTQESTFADQRRHEHNADGSQRTSDSVHRDTERGNEGQEERRAGSEHQTTLRQVGRADDTNQRGTAQQRLNARDQSRLDGAIARLSRRVEAARVNRQVFPQYRSAKYSNVTDLSREPSNAALTGAVNELAGNIHQFHGEEVLVESLPHITQALEQLGLSVDKTMMQGNAIVPSLVGPIEKLATAIVELEADALLTQVMVTLGDRLQHWGQNQHIADLADAIVSVADLQVIIDSGLGDRLLEVASVIERQMPQQIAFEGMDELAELMHAGDVEQDLAALLPPLTQALQVLEKELDCGMKRSVVEQASGAVFQWHEEQRLVIAMAEGDPAQVLASLQQLSEDNLRSQVAELAQAMQGWHEQQIIAEVAAEFSGVMERLRGGNGIEALAETITKRQAMLEVAEAISDASSMMLEWSAYPQMGELVQLIQEQQQIDVLLDGSLVDKLNHIGRSLETMTHQQPSLDGVQELAQAIHETHQQDAVAEHMQALVGMSDHVEQWIEQQADVQQLSLLVMALRSNPQESIAELEALTEQMRSMGLDVTPTPQQKETVIVEKPKLKATTPIEKPVKQTVEKPVRKLREDWQERPKVVPIEKPENNAPVWSEARLQALELMRPEHIEAHAWKELIVDSAISPLVSAQYFESMDGDRAKEFLLSHALGQVSGHGQQYVTKSVAKFMKRYEHLDAGGLWCHGVPVDGEPWGQLKPNNPVKESKDIGRFKIKLQSSEVLNLPKPENYQEQYKVRKYESIPKQIKQTQQELDSEREEEFVDEALLDFDALDNKLMEAEELENESLRSHFAFCDDLQTLQDDSSIPIWQTEGAKKGAALYSQGLNAIALNGVNGGYQKNEDESRSLAEHLRDYDWEGRTTILVFDKDPIQKVNSQQRVAIALYRYGQILEMEGAEIMVAQMPGQDDIKMGVDDFLAQGNKLSDLEVMTYDQWVEQNPYVQAHLERIEREIGQDLEIEDDGMEH